MSYAIISVGGKQYRVREGQRLLVDRVAVADGETITPAVLLVGGDGEAQIAPESIVVTARVVSQQRGPKIRIGKYKQRVGYKRHTGFRASLTQIEIETIGAGTARASKAKVDEARQQPQQAQAQEAQPQKTTSTVPPGYAEMTVADVKGAVGGWELPALQAALEHEQAHGQRKGAIAALESAIATREEGQ
jgi:large subunit ribosomal protein L21